MTSRRGRGIEGFRVFRHLRKKSGLLEDYELEVWAAEEGETPDAELLRMRMRMMEG